MSQQSSCFILVMLDNLSATPVAFQQYVAEYFKEVTFFGKQAYAAVTTSGEIKTYGLGQKKGVAPSHSVDLMSFGSKEGYPEGVDNLNGWLRHESNKSNPVVFYFYESWNDGNLDSCED